MGPRIDTLTFRPDLSHEHLGIFLAQIREGMPAELWRIIEPYTLIPQAWDSNKYGVCEPMDRTTGPWRFELNAPLKWHELLPTVLGSVVELTNTRPTLNELGAAWRILKREGLNPSIAVNLGPAPSGKWLMEVVAIVSGGTLDRNVALDVADILGGQFGGQTVWPEGVWWRTSDVACAEADEAESASKMYVIY